MNINSVYILEDRSVIYISGDDSESFLQNLISNDIRKVTESKSCFASLLTPQGKYLYEFIIVKYKKGYLLECEKKIANELFDKLTLYKLRSKVEILNLSNEFVVAVLSQQKFLSMANSQNIPGYTIRYRRDTLYLDPRHSKLGARLIINLEKLHLSLKLLNLKSSNIDEYYAFSRDLGIPQINTNKLQNEIFGIECNLEELNGIDFKKGCYIGQENTARIKLKNKLNKRLFAIKVLSGKVNQGETIYLNNTEIGKILINGKFSFGVIKFKSLKEDQFNLLNTLSGKISILNPDWIKIKNNYKH